MKAPTARRKASKSRRPRGDTRALLLEATSRILSEHNAIDVSLSEIAEVSGLNSALIKYHFGNKEGLLMALVERDALRSLEQLNQLVAMPIPPEQKIRLHIAGIINTYARYPYLNRLIHTLLDNPNPAVARSIVDFLIRPLIQAQTRILEEGAKLGIFRQVDPMHFYYSVSGACDIIFYARHSLEIVFGVTELTPKFREAYIAEVADSALRVLSPTAKP